MLVVSFVGLAGSLYVAMWPGDLRLPSLIGGSGFAIFAFILITGLFKVRSSSGGKTAAGGEDEYHGSARFATENEIQELTIKRGQIIL